MDPEREASWDLLLALGELEYRAGDWTTARAHAVELAGHGHGLLLLLDAVAGDADGARHHAQAGLHSGSWWHTLYAHAGLGLLELGLDRPEAAILHLEIVERGGFDAPGHVHWRGDLVESQIRAGLDDAAHRTLQRFAAHAELARGRGLLGAPETVFAQAVQTSFPFERARTELCWGERLRRDGRRVDARGHLRAAHRAFAALGAVPWAEKAARELRSSGGRAQRGPRAGSRELTAQETLIATMVAEGKTNKRIATTLFLSPKTIEFHLGHVYRKLEVHNRTELTRWLLTD